MVCLRTPDTSCDVEAKWLEDFFVSLAESSSFSHSANLRQVTRPALSHRNWALEAWDGIDRVDGPHTSLAFTFFPHWVMDLRKRFAGMKTQPIALNVHDAVVHVTEGGCDLLMTYHRPSQPLQLNSNRHEMPDRRRDLDRLRQRRSVGQAAVAPA